MASVKALQLRSPTAEHGNCHRAGVPGEWPHQAGPVASCMATAAIHHAMMMTHVIHSVEEEESSTFSVYLHTVCTCQIVTVTLH